MVKQLIFGFKWKHIQTKTPPYRKRVYTADQFLRVNAYAIGAGWYAISIGPFGEDEAQSRLFELRSTGAIPIDSFLSRGSNYQDKIWPLDVAAEPQPVSETITSSALDTDIRTLSAEPDETLGEARMSEQALSRDEKKQLQIALKSAGIIPLRLMEILERAQERPSPRGKTTKACRDRRFDHRTAGTFTVAI